MLEPLSSAEPELIRHITVSTGLPNATAARVIADVLAYFDETVEDFIRRRHHELRLRQLKNDEIWSAISAEMSARRFGARALSQRQLRRIVYG
ncbi:MAG: hypothetical protein ABSF03_00315 [Streptosporangiaceae bacterium]|jgi:hypothetical protein